MKLDEIADCLKVAAAAELFGINQLEAFAAQPGASPAIEQTVSHVRRQARALGLAHRIVLLAADYPELAKVITDEAGT